MMENLKCVGAICGDICGQPMEFTKDKIKNYELLSLGGQFTDDTVLTIAVMDWLVNDKKHTKDKLIDIIKEYGRKYWYAGYGGTFNDWMHSENREPYYSWGNGSGMRTSPIGWFFNDIGDVMNYAEVAASITHNHPEGIKGAQAISTAIYLARNGATKEQIKAHIETVFCYDLNRSVEEMALDYTFHVSCQKSVPESIICFLESDSVESAIQNAIYMGGDTDTMADMAGAIAEAYYNEEQTQKIK